jgi:hypothetical protein
MSHEAEISITPSAPIAPSAAAERMRNHRERRRKKMRCLMIELREKEIDVLIRKGLLLADARNELYAVRDALYRHLDDTLNA